MSLAIVRRLSVLLLVSIAACPAVADARTAVARIERVATPVATLQGVEVRLAWPDGAEAGTLRLRAERLDAPDLGYRFRNLDWTCPLQREGSRWRCSGALRAGGSRPFEFSFLLDDAHTQATLARGAARIHVRRAAAQPTLTRIDLTAVPLEWTQALLAQAWSEARFTAGTGDASLTIAAPERASLRITGPVVLRGAGLDTPDGRIAAEQLGARFDLDAEFGDVDRIAIDGRLEGGELLFDRTYVALGARTVPLQVQARQAGGGRWELPVLTWRDAGVLEVDARALLAPDGTPTTLGVEFRSPVLQALAAHYLSGWLGSAGLGDLRASGGARGALVVDDGEVESAALVLDDAGFDDPRGRFAFEGLAGDVRFSAGAAIDSALAWRKGALYGLPFGPARLPWTSGGGAMRLREDLAVGVLGGSLRIEDLVLRPPAGGERFDVRFGLGLDGLEVSQLAQAMEWPAFGGTLSGRIPQARYREDRLTFDGGLSMQLFDGQVAVSAVAMERPFGTAPTMTADIALDDLDLEALTGVFGFGSITGRLDGRIDGLRLVDWQPVAFDARLQTDRRRGVRQRISQRAVQDLSSVGDASFVNTLQGQALALFDDFGYSRIGIGCRLVDEVCTMNGLGSAGRAFTIVEGAGLPRLTVVGFNQRVDWPTLVERLAAVGSGDVRPVVD
ncbi:hypothetical protein [Cognatilysobacter bugurensis]|uniref:Dicarboxylate transport domain-containing protein n=1 Tax=Cognatilysobacter bugurensis TaxID=543356 RepID=A0A918W3X5_9GAMM|nr:hypothetical protein [Lysobacter bugurensis]GHA70021.1 hypothetical protein GCM10007067_02550 [Lysobacter bugurensis]